MPPPPPPPKPAAPVEVARGGGVHVRNSDGSDIPPAPDVDLGNSWPGKHVCTAALKFDADVLVECTLRDHGWGCVA